MRAARYYALTCDARHDDATRHAITLLPLMLTSVDAAIRAAYG